MTDTPVKSSRNPPYKRLILGIESSCDDTAMAIVAQSRDGRFEVLVNRVASQIDDHAAFGGVVPEIAARAHVDALGPLYQAIMHDFKTQYDGDLHQIDAIAATSGPGLIGGVMVGLSFAKGLALMGKKPLFGINHLEGHALSPALAASDQPLRFPYLLLLVSGGHCQILAVHGLGRYERLGTTLDDAAGEAFDKTAKILELGYPGGPAIEQEAINAQAGRFSLPRPLPPKDGLHFSFSGLKTAASRLAFEQVKTKADRSDLCHAVQDAICWQLLDRTHRAMSRFQSQYPDLDAPLLVVAGGVAANKVLRSGLMDLARSRGFGWMAPPLSYCTDNGAMIAVAGHFHADQIDTKRDDNKDLSPNRDDILTQMALSARPRWPLDTGAATAFPVHKHVSEKGAKS